mmetsp:Transcript_57396/g.162976  ORF Transcript_57396/g.162976 Transcript_57396/m.162976 type:complete len:220 (+) Transcript_57396:808-1467(+)
MQERGAEPVSTPALHSWLFRRVSQPQRAVADQAAAPDATALVAVRILHDRRAPVDLCIGTCGALLVLAASFPEPSLGDKVIPCRLHRRGHSRERTHHLSGILVRELGPLGGGLLTRKPGAFEQTRRRGDICLGTGRPSWKCTWQVDAGRLCTILSLLITCILARGLAHCALSRQPRVCGHLLRRQQGTCDGAVCWRALCACRGRQCGSARHRYLGCRHL